MGPLSNIVFIFIYIYIYISIPTLSNRSPLQAFADLKVAGGDLLEGAGAYKVTWGLPLKKLSWLFVR